MHELGSEIKHKWRRLGWSTWTFFVFFWKFYGMLLPRFLVNSYSLTIIYIIYLAWGASAFSFEPSS